MNALQSIAIHGGAAYAPDVMHDTGRSAEEVYTELVHLEAAGVIQITGRLWELTDQTMAEPIARLAR